MKQSVSRSDWVRALVQYAQATIPITSRTVGRPEASKRRRSRRTKKLLREAPPEQIAEIVAELEPRKRQEISRAIDRKSLEHQKEREQAADEKLREKLGDETVDDLEFAEKLKSTEYLLITARGNLRGFVRQPARSARAPGRLARVLSRLDRRPRRPPGHGPGAPGRRQHRLDGVRGHARTGREVN